MSAVTSMVYIRAGPVRPHTIRLVDPTPTALINTWLGGLRTEHRRWMASAMSTRVMLSGRVRIAVWPLEIVMTRSAAVWMRSWPEERNRAPASRQAESRKTPIAGYLSRAYPEIPGNTAEAWSWDGPVS